MAPSPSVFGIKAAFAYSCPLSEEMSVSVPSFAEVKEYGSKLYDVESRPEKVKVALTNNSKTPIPASMSLMKSLHKKDLKALTRNRNISSVVCNAAKKLFQKKYQRS